MKNVDAQGLLDTGFAMIGTMQAMTAVATDLAQQLVALKLCHICRRTQDGMGGSFCSAPHRASRQAYVIGKLCDVIENLTTLPAGPDSIMMKRVVEQLRMFAGAKED